MAFHRLGGWFLSETGRNFSFGVATVAAMGAFCAQTLPNTLLMDQYKNIVHLYKKGLSVPVPPYLVDRFNKALDLMEVPSNEKHLYKPFSVIGFELFHVGSSYSKFGSNIGLPINFSYTDVDAIDKHSIKVLGESVMWDLAEAKDFLNSLVLSEKAQLYGMAREINMTQTPKLLLDSMYGTLSVIFAYGLGRNFNQKFHLYAKPLSTRLILYGLVGSFATINYLFLKDFTQLYYEKAVDDQLKETNPIFIEGAKEFYEKILKRNKALRSLMGNEGKEVYSVLGNENYLFRQKHLPIVQRKAFFETNLEQ